MVCSTEATPTPPPVVRLLSIRNAKVHHRMMLPLEDKETTTTKTYYILNFYNKADGGSAVLDTFNQTGSYIPDSAYIVFATEAEIRRFVEGGNKLLAEPPRRLQPFEKYDSRQDHFTFRDDHEATPVELVAVVHPSSKEATKSAICGATNNTASLLWTCHVPPVSDRLSVLTTARHGQQVLELLARHPHVSWVTRTTRMALFNNNAQWITQSNVRDQRPVWSKGIKGSGEIVACGDSGLDVGSCYFKDTAQSVAYFPNTNTNHRKIISYVPSDCECTERGASKAGAPATSGDTSDVVNGHGTHVVGSICGYSPEFNSNSGMAPEAKIAFLDLEDPSLSTAALRALYPGYKLDEKYYPRAKSLGAFIHSNSWGTNAALGVTTDGVGGSGVSTPTSYDLYSVDTDTYAWNNKDYLILFAAGNDGSRGARTVAMPANAKNIVTVGALWKSTDLSERNDVAFFSSFGPTFDGRVKPDVVAPGNDITSAASDGGGTNSQCNAAIAQSGTSMATPIVAGSAALIRQYLREGYHHTGRVAATNGIAKPTAALLKALLVSSAISMLGWKKLAYSDPTGTYLNTTRPSYINGFGAVKLDNVMLFDKAAEGSRPYDVWFAEEYKITNTTKTWSWCFTVGTEIHPLKAVLVWTDYPASLQTSKALVTDLDLIVYNDVGETRRGNQDLSGEYTFDSINNVEMVEFPAPTSGKYRVIVSLKGDMIPAVSATGQPFAVVITGNIGAVSTTDNCPGSHCAANCLGNGLCQRDTTTTDGRSCLCGGANSHVDCSVVCAASPQCSSHGCSVNGTCTCYSDYVRGFWSGTVCSTCDAAHVGSDCTVARDCSSRGSLVNTNGKYVCECHSDVSRGYWSGSSCEKCASSWYGSNCRCGSSNCNGRGTCTASGCSCFNDNARGHWTQAVGPTCLECEWPWSGPRCMCNTNCSNNGVCSDSGCTCFDDDTRGHYALSNYTCNTCKAGWTGPTCLCQISNDAVCGGHGDCTSTGCLCSSIPATGWWTNSTPGTCDVCSSFAYGSGCRCLASDCSGHGTCAETGCVCKEDAASGYWTESGGTCQKCMDGWFGDGCLCRSSDCDGHGLCTQRGCECFRNATHPDAAQRGFFEGTSTCTKCAVGWSTYPLCLCASDNCNGHGTCSATQGCVCYNDTQRGYWSSTLGVTSCDVCLDGFYGTDCKCGRNNCRILQGSNMTAQSVDTVTFEDKTTFNIVATGVLSGGTEFTFVKVEAEDTDHPSKASPLGYKWVGTTFRWLVSTTQTRQSAAANGGVSTNSWNTFSSPVDVVLSPTPAMLSGIVTSSLTVMYLHPVDGWKALKESCSGVQQRETFDSTILQVRTRACGMMSTSLVALYGSETTTDLTQTYILIGVCSGGAVVLLITTLIVRYRRMLREEKRQREAKELVLKFMTENKRKGKSLRDQLALGLNDSFTCEVAVSRFVSALMKRRAIVDRLLQQPKYRRVLELSAALQSNGLPTDSVQQAATTLSDISSKPVAAVWEFRQHELDLWEACRRMRGMFTYNILSKEYELQPGVLDDTRRRMVDLTIENAKLRRMISATERRRVREQEAEGVGGQEVEISFQTQNNNMTTTGQQDENETTH
eukprot:PhM_4_TR9411/c0_g1_i1/m.54786